MHHQTRPGQGEGAQQPAGQAEWTGQRSAPATGEVTPATPQGGPTTPQAGGGPPQPPGQPRTGLALQDVETTQQRAAVDAIARAIQTCEWCADQCVQLADPNMIECIRLCRDVSDLGETALALLPRNSRYAQSVLSTLEQAVQACGQECGRHSHAHCQECSQVLGRAAEAIQQCRATAGEPTQQPTSAR